MSFPVVLLTGHKSGCPTGRAHRKILDFSRVKISIPGIAHVSAYAERSIGNLVRYFIAAQVYKPKSHLACELDVGEGDGIIGIPPFLNQGQILKCVRLICILRPIILFYIRVQLDDRSGPPLLIFRAGHFLDIIAVCPPKGASQAPECIGIFAQVIFRRCQLQRKLSLSHIRCCADSKVGQEQALASSAQVILIPPLYDAHRSGIRFSHSVIVTVAGEGSLSIPKIIGYILQRAAVHGKAQHQQVVGIGHRNLI